MPTDTATPAVRQRRKPESDAVRQRRLLALEVALADREHRAREALSGLRGTLPRNRGHVTPLTRIKDDEERLAVWRARVERLEALLDQTERKRETRAKIVLSTTLLAQAAEDPDDALLARLRAIVDQRVHRPRDRLAIAETLGLAISPVKTRTVPDLPDFDALADEILREDTVAPDAPSAPRRRKKGG